MYDTVGFHQAYLILGCITLSFTLLSFVTLRGGNRLLPTAETQSPPDSSAPVRDDGLHSTIRVSPPRFSSA